MPTSHNITATQWQRVHYNLIVIKLELSLIGGGSRKSDHSMLGKMHCAYILWEIDGFINVDVYGPSSHLKYPQFWTINIYIVLEYLMLPW